jgi:hypothetical protein
MASWFSFAINETNFWLTKREKQAPTGCVPIIGVGRARLIADIAELEVEWLGGRRAVEVIITGGDDSLLGTELLNGDRGRVDYIAPL